MLRVLVLGETLPIFLKTHFSNYDIEWHTVPILRLDQIVSKVKFALSTMNKDTAIHVLVTDFSWHQIGACRTEKRFDSANRVLKHFCKTYHNHETSPSCRIFVLNLYETPFHTNNPCPILSKRILEARDSCRSKFERGKNISTGVINILDCYQKPVDSLFKDYAPDFALSQTTYIRNEPTQEFLVILIRRIHNWLSARH